MLIVDDLLLAPVKGFFFICEQVHKAARAEAQDPRPILQQLQELYMRLETGKITEEQFDRQEKVLLDRLEQVEKDGQAG